MLNGNQDQLKQEILVMLEFTAHQQQNIRYVCEVYVMDSEPLYKRLLIQSSQSKTNRVVL